MIIFDFMVRNQVIHAILIITETFEAENKRQYSTYGVLWSCCVIVWEGGHLQIAVFKVQTEVFIATNLEWGILSGANVASATAAAAVLA